jgi:hypothetical protein
MRLAIDVALAAAAIAGVAGNTAVIVVAAIKPGLPVARRGRIGIIALDTLLAVAAVPGLAPRWVAQVAIASLPLTLLAIAFALLPPRIGGDPPWWPEFERAFRRYARRRDS